MKSFFRPCVITSPDTGLIYDLLLRSEGFVETQMLAVKFKFFLSMSERDIFVPFPLFGIKAMKCILQVASRLSLFFSEESECTLCGRALREFVVPRVQPEYTIWIEAIISDIFGAAQVQESTKCDDDSWISLVKGACEHLEIQMESISLAAVIQIQSLMDFRHAVIMLGEVGAGKTTHRRLLAEIHHTEQSITGQSKQRINGKLEVIDINPKAVTWQEFYGFVDSNAEWNDGIFTKFLRSIDRESPNYHWIVLDATLSSDWIETLQPILDENKLLALPNGRKLSLNSKTHIIFESSELLHATPSALAYSGIINIPESNAWRNFCSRCDH